MNLCAQNGDLKVEIERIILHDTDISLDDTPGFIVGIVDQDSTYFVDYGSKIKNENLGLNAGDIFETGSISKVFTSSLVSVLVDKGLISYDRKINDFLPINIQNPRMDDITILDLIQHTSGLPVRPYFFGAKEKDPQNPYGYYEKEDLLQFYTNFVPKSSEEFFKERKKGVVTQGYDRAGRAVEPWSFASFGASEGIRTSASDLMQFMKVNIGLTDHPFSKIFAENHKKEVDTNFNESIKTGRGWQIIDQRKRYDIITHNGKTNGHNVFIAFIKETGTGVIVLSNSNIGTRDLGFLVLRMINYNWKRSKSKS